jgi:hypothetical protein
VSLTNAYTRAVLTTNGSGAWSSTVPVGKMAFVSCSYDNAGTKYTSYYRPFQQ